MKLAELIDQHYDQLNENDLYLWQYINHHQQDCLKMSIHELARKCNLSHSTIIRFTKKLGLDGFSELKYCLKWSQQKQKSFDHNDLKKISDELKNTLTMIENNDLEHLLQAIKNAQHIYIYPTGDVQRHVAKELKREFIYCKKIFYIIEGISELDNVIQYCTHDDLFILISFSGQQETIMTLAKTLKKLNIKTIGIAAGSSNTLAHHVTYYIGFQTSVFSTGQFQSEYTCGVHYFLIANMLFLKYLEYCS